MIHYYQVRIVSDTALIGTLNTQFSMLLSLTLYRSAEHTQDCLFKIKNNPDFEDTMLEKENILHPLDEYEHKEIS